MRLFSAMTDDGLGDENTGTQNPSRRSRILEGSEEGHWLTGSRTKEGGEGHRSLGMEGGGKWKRRGGEEEWFVISAILEHNLLMIVLRSLERGQRGEPSTLMRPEEDSRKMGHVSRVVRSQRDFFKSPMRSFEIPEAKVGICCLRTESAMCLACRRREGRDGVMGSSSKVLTKSSEEKTECGILGTGCESLAFLLGRK